MTIHPYDEWHEDFGPVLWLAFEEGCAPGVYSGSPLCSDWPGDDFTCWTDLPDYEENQRVDAAVRRMRRGEAE